MPELAEVHWFARRWSAGLGATVTAVRLRERERVFREGDAAALATGLVGRRPERVLTAGKLAAFAFSGEAMLLVHLGMTGRLFTKDARDAQPGWARETASRPPDPAHDLLEIDCDNGVTLVYNDSRRFGLVTFHPGPGLPERWLRRPPEILSDAFDAAHLNRALDSGARRAIKTVLLDQDRFPGIGNWMADETLWRAAINPHTPAGALSPDARARLLLALRSTCADALRVIGEAWGEPPDSWLFNHRWRSGGVCPATGQPLRYERIGGRTTCWSPARQA